MSMDYKDLNKVIPKDDFPLSHIDVLINNVVVQTVYFILNGFSEYNQIIGLFAKLGSGRLLLFPDLRLERFLGFGCLASP